MGFILRNSLALLFSFSFVFIAEQKPIKLHPNASNLRWNLFFRSARTFLVSPFVGPSARPQQKCQLMEIHYKSLHYHVRPIMEKLKYTNTKCLKDPTCAIFLKSRGFTIRYYICQKNYATAILGSKNLRKKRKLRLKHVRDKIA